LLDKQIKDMGYQVQGFKASAVSAGLKKDKALDLALIFSEKVSAAQRKTASAF